MSDDKSYVPPPQPPAEPQNKATPVTPETRPVGHASFGFQLFMGLVSSGLLSLGIAWLLLMVALTKQSLRNAGMLMALSVIPLGLGVLVFVLRRKHGSGLVVGLLIGLGFFALAAGICFSMAG
jgi:hypothetical protein